MDRAKAFKLGLVLAMGVGLAGCTSIRESRGYVVDPVLVNSIQPGIDNRQSVEGTLGRPSYVSEYGEKTWYYISSITGRKPFVRPRIKSHSVLAVSFDDAGNVVRAETSGVEQLAYISPDGDETPTLGRERGFLEDLFGNIGQVGAPGPGGGAGPGG
ncbi:outer membrane protein assembly factor BamE [Altererythrobacter arenosus]|uniref:Outer membrane protein assembly factor BamE n=1 Tax=Altererythrobacter arenosus TaxID=3032592 RepID=A0ABY8FTN6_9SPHN|nr:outer membrane protein assembly factor BamE [Altererythrobacter sp. CAU 1644]WFL78197.1 outer membrane protein assembly factor BamE [Altererythrobacter sp. CAU 1644]